MNNNRYSGYEWTLGAWRSSKAERDERGHSDGLGASVRKKQGFFFIVEYVTSCVPQFNSAFLNKKEGTQLI